MTAADRIYMAGFAAALAIARVTADKIAAGPLPPLRKELAAEALRAFAAEATEALANAADKLSAVSGGANAAP